MTCLLSGGFSFEFFSFHAPNLKMGSILRKAGFPLIDVIYDFKWNLFLLKLLASF